MGRKFVFLSQHRKLADRVAAAQTFVADHPQPEGLVWFVDDMSNSFNTAYASWPFRFWVLLPPHSPPQLPLGQTAETVGSEGMAHTKDWSVGFKPMPRGGTYNLGELDAFLLSMLSCKVRAVLPRSTG
jgi:hypothetical protein